MSTADRTYLEHGKPVTVVAQWRHRKPADIALAVHWYTNPSPGPNYGKPVGKSGPRNVAIRRQDGEVVVRPFRGLRKVLEAGACAKPVRG